MLSKFVLAVSYLWFCCGLPSRLHRATVQEEGLPLSNIFVGHLDFPDSMFECQGPHCPYRLQFTSFADALSTIQPRIFQQFWPTDDKLEQSGFENRYGVADETKNLPNMLLQNLSSKHMDELSACPRKKLIKGDTGGGESGRVVPAPSWAEDGEEIWILIVGEHPSAEKVNHILTEATNHGHRFILLGPFEEGQFENKYIKTIQMPYASISFAARGSNTPLDLLDRSGSVGERKYIAGYQARDCTYQREQMWDAVCEVVESKNKKCTHITDCNGFSNLGDAWVDDVGDLEDGTTVYDQSVKRYGGFKFVVTVESDRGEIGQKLDGYVTEKIVDGLLAKSVPIYGFSIGASSIFNPESFLFWDGKNTTEVAARVGELLDDDAKYERMVTAPAITEANLVKFFSWHPAVWPKYGDSLRMKIINTITGWCKE